MIDTKEFQSLLNTLKESYKYNNSTQTHKIYSHILSTYHDSDQVLVELGKLCVSMSDNVNAETALKRAAEIKPTANNYYLLGTFYLMKGEYLIAVDTLEKSLSIDITLLVANKDLGTAYQYLKKYDTAISHYEKYLNSHPNNISTLYNIGLIKLEQCEYKDAKKLFKSAISINPDIAGLHLSLGRTLYLLNENHEAETHCRIALSLNDKIPEAYYNLGTILFDRLQFCDAEQCFIQALQLNRQFIEAEISLANTLLTLGEPAKARTHYHNVISKGDTPAAHSNYLLCLHYLYDNDINEIFEEHTTWFGMYMSAIENQYSHDIYDPEKILNIGYISSNFCKHSVAYFLVALFKYNNKNINIYCYSDTERYDNYTLIFQNFSTAWRDIRSSSNSEVGDQIRKDKIDILVDLAGHTDNGHYRLNLFNSKPAPVQATYLGYPDTTGMDTIDYRITDSTADPKGSEQWHTESLALLKTGFLCYTPPNDSPDTSIAPATLNDYITFGSFNNLAKISPETLDTWIKILQQVPNSRLLIKTKAFFDPNMIQRYKTYLVNYDIDISRIEILGWAVDTNQHLDLYSKIDIALDTFPYNGTTTTCEALWMGVPVLTLEGKTHCSRVGCSLLKSANLEHYISKDREEYISKAVDLAKNIDEVCNTRKTLRQHVLNTNLFNGKHFTRQLNNLYRKMWEIKCEENDSSTDKI